MTMPYDERQTNRDASNGDQQYRQALRDFASMGDSAIHDEVPETSEEIEVLNGVNHLQQL
jgi:hypothetical protein